MIVCTYTWTLLDVSQVQTQAP